MYQQVKRLNLKKLSETCGASKMEVFQNAILSATNPGDIVEVIVGDADTWFALKGLGEELGYEVISESKRSDSEYVLLIRIT